ncbi:putative KRAB box and zinc finger C2H2 type domain containing protein [Operophtera brumata]|uniref:Putative KRAB box and zinc finger C2H2 type domain containing protein n=1 Tax=Operophtera brumata TaxID=104452 RepID=A0A0L7L5R5_OPEBR|nr:putative KRAB box and zinc finger C2H2 type domain containing protein [Operophtera brumata]
MKSNVNLVYLYDPVNLDENSNIQLVQLLLECAAIEVKIDDGLPQKLCEECIKVLQLTFTFRSQAARAEEQYRILIQEKVKQEIKAETEHDYDDYSFENILKYDSDEKEHKEIDEEIDKKVYTCPKCDKIYTKERKYLKHLELHQSQYSCAYCCKQFLRESALQKHLWKHNVNRCQICGDMFADEALLMQHIATHNVPTIKNEDEQKSTYPCNECEKTFSSTRSLSVHKKKHQKEEPLSYTCDVCRKEFVSKALVKRHLKLHMTSHMVTHSGAHPHACGTCGASFTKPTSLKKHAMIHTGQRPYGCDTCLMT